MAVTTRTREGDDLVPHEPEDTTTASNAAAVTFDAVIGQLDYAARQWADHHVAMSDLDVVVGMIEDLGGTFTVTITAPDGQTHTRTITQT